jgi:hypothetical protein
MIIPPIKKLRVGDCNWAMKSFTKKDMNSTDTSWGILTKNIEINEFERAFHCKRNLIEEYGVRSTVLFRLKLVAF